MFSSAIWRDNFLRGLYLELYAAVELPEQAREELRTTVTKVTRKTYILSLSHTKKHVASASKRHILSYITQTTEQYFSMELFITC